MALLLIEPPPPKDSPTFDSWINRFWNALRSDATTVDLGSAVAGTLPVANGGTGATTAAAARTNLDVPKRDGTDATGTWGISISGNAATVTNGLYSTGSYNDPSWLTGLSVAKINCTTTNDNASSGDLGEYVESLVNSGSAVSLTTDTDANVTSISLTAGDWDVRGIVHFDPAASTVVSDFHVSVSTTSATQDTAVNRHAHHSLTNGPAAHELSVGVSSVRMSLASTTTVYLVATSTFSASTIGAYGALTARRVR